MDSRLLMNKWPAAKMVQHVSEMRLSVKHTHVTYDSHQRLASRAIGSNEDIC